MIYLVSLHRAGGSRIRGFPQFLVIGRDAGHAAERAWTRFIFLFDCTATGMTGGPVRYDVANWGEIVIQPLDVLPAEKIKSLLPLIERDWGT